MANVFEGTEAWTMGGKGGGLVGGFWVRGMGWWERGEEGRTLWSSEVDHIPVFFKHVYLLDGLNRLDVEFFEGGLEFFVVGAGCFVDFLYFSPGGAFASMVEEWLC